MPSRSACRPTPWCSPGSLCPASCPIPKCLPTLPLPTFTAPLPHLHLLVMQGPLAWPTGPNHRLRSGCRANRTPRLDMPRNKNRSRAQPFILCHVGLASKTLCDLNRPQRIREGFAPRRPLAQERQGACRQHFGCRWGLKKSTDLAAGGFQTIAAMQWPGSTSHLQTKYSCKSQPTVSRRPLILCSTELIPENTTSRLSAP